MHLKRRCLQTQPVLVIGLFLFWRGLKEIELCPIIFTMYPCLVLFHICSGALHRLQADFNAAIDDYLLAMDKTDHNEGNKTYMEAQRQLLLCYNDFAVECFR